MVIGQKKEKKMKIKMPQFRVEKNAGHFWLEDMPAITGRKKIAGNGKFGPEKNAGKFGPKIKMPVFSGGDKIAGELTGLL